MIYRLVADLILILHFSFAVFAVLGGLLALRRPNAVRIHLPVLCWGVVVQWADWTCPLTPLENYFRRLGGESAYPGSFIEYYISKMLYPENLTLELRYVLGLLLIVVNLAIYSHLYVSARRRRTAKQRKPHDSLPA